MVTFAQVFSFFCCCCCCCFLFTNSFQSDSNSKISKTRYVRMVMAPVPYAKDIKIRINQIVTPESISAIRIRHIAVATQELANHVKSMITTDGADFGDLAEKLSLCDETRNNRGETSWLSTTTDQASSQIPAEVINAAQYLNKGDMIITSSKKSDPVTSMDTWTFHILQLIDVMTKLSPTLTKRRRDAFVDMKGIERDTAIGTYFFETMGCQMNVADSERMEGQLIDLGYVKSDDAITSNVIVLNTCSIRDHAEQKVYSYLGPHAIRKKKGEDVAIVVAGCVAQQEGEVLARRFPEIDIVMGPQYSNRLTDLLESVAEGNQVVATDPAYQMEDQSTAKRRSDVSAFVNVIYGCNERCTYCVVPNTRGVEQSRTKEAIVAEIADLVEHGYKEVTLLGQNVDAWGRDFNPKQKFADLLSACGEVPGIERVRFITSHPRYMTERVIIAVAQNSKLMPCFNVPFQSGDDVVLHNMRRGYNKEKFMSIVRAIRHHVPDAAITTDVIVGFPGETEEQFQHTLDVMNEVVFEQVNTAAYSPRPNTPAAEWDSQLTEEVKQDRLQRINRLGNEHALSRSQRFLGRIQEVLVEDVNLKDPSQVYGRNPHSRLVYLKGKIAELKGRIVKVLITEARGYSLTGELVED